MELASLQQTRRSCSRVNYNYPVTRIETVEFSFKGTVLFVAGGIDGQDQGASLAAVKFSSQPKVIAEIVVPDSGSLVCSMKRHEAGNILFLGSKSKVDIYFFDGNTFSLLASYPNLFDASSEIIHLQILGQDLFCLAAGQNRILRINYSEPPLVPMNHLTAEKSQTSLFGLKSKSARVVGGELIAAGNEEAELTISGRLVTLKDGKDTPQESHIAGRWSDCKFDQFGNLAAAELPGNCLKILNKDGKVIASAEPDGPQNYEPFEEKKYKVYEQQTFLWPSGSGFLVVVDTQKLEFDKVPALGGFGGTNPLAHICLSCSNGTKILTVAYKQDTQTSHFNYWTKSENSQVVTKPIDRLFPKRNILLT